MDNAPSNSIKNSIPAQLVGTSPIMVKGHPRMGGKPKGYKSTVSRIRELLQRPTIDADGNPITLHEAALLKQIDMAIKDGDKAALTLLLKQAKDYVEDAKPLDPSNNNFYNVDTLNQIINKGSFLEVDEDEPIEIEASESNEEDNIGTAVQADGEEI